MALCPNCGREVSDDASFCPACGATVAAGEGAMPPPQVQPPPAAAPTPQPPGPPMGTQPPYAQPPAGVTPAYTPGMVPPPPAKKKMASGWKIAIIVGLAFILLLAVGGTLLGIFIFGAVKAPVDVTNRYIEAINEGDAAEAWDLLHPDSPFKELYTLSSFESDVVESNVKLTAWNANEVEVMDSRATVGVDMELVDGEEFRIEFELRKDGSEWRIYDYSYVD